jgi:sensor c-di-GMP phosphodiesterase-like protein
MEIIILSMALAWLFSLVVLVIMIFIYRKINSISNKLDKIIYLNNIDLSDKKL